MQRSTIMQPISFESWLPAAQGKEPWQNEDTMRKMWWWISAHTLYWKLRQLHFGCHPYGYVKKTHPVRFPAMHWHQDWRWKNWKTTGANREPTNIQSKLLFKCQMIVVTSDLTSYVMAPGHLVSLYPFRLAGKPRKILGSITTRCSENELALFPKKTLLREEQDPTRESSWLEPDKISVCIFFLPKLIYQVTSNVTI